MLIMQEFIAALPWPYLSLWIFQHISDYSHNNSRILSVQNDCA